MADLALGNPLGNPLGLMRAEQEPRQSIVHVITENGSFDIPERFSFAILRFWGMGGVRSLQQTGTYFGGGGGGYAGTKPIRLSGLLSRRVTVSNNNTCEGLGYTLTTIQPVGREGGIGVGGDFNFRGGRGGGATRISTTTYHGGGGGAAGPFGDGADGAGWGADLTPIPAGLGASGGGGVNGANGGGGGGGGGGIGNGGGGSAQPPSVGVGLAPYSAPALNGSPAIGASGGAGGLGGGGAGGGIESTPASPGGFMLEIELW